MKHVIYAKILRMLRNISKPSALFAGLFLVFESLPAAINITGTSFAEDIVGVTYREDGSLVFQNTPATGENAESTAVGLIALIFALGRRFR